MTLEIDRTFFSDDRPDVGGCNLVALYECWVSVLGKELQYAIAF